jgi:uncharacterized protein YggU (UPF0235/DUF167 family)
VKPFSRVEAVEKIDESHYVVKVRARPIEGEANRRVIELLSDFWQRPTSAFWLKSGHASKSKVIELRLD